MTHPTLPYRGEFGARRPAAIAELALPPEPMPARQGMRPLKAWRYVGVYGPELMICVGAVRIGPARQTFWAVWDRVSGRLHERTAIGRGGVRVQHGMVAVQDEETRIELSLDENAGIETVSPSGASYGWTRKQGGIRATGTVVVDGHARRVDALAVIDDTSAYYQRHTSWMWSAGVGATTDGRPVAWNLVTGVNDAVKDSERTVWVDGEPHEVGPAAFATDLSSVSFDGGLLTFEPEAVREANENMVIIRSRYRQPFGTFMGTLGKGVELGEGFGVMEEHDVHW